MQQIRIVGLGGRFERLIAEAVHALAGGTRIRRKQAAG